MELQRRLREPFNARALAPQWLCNLQPKPYMWFGDHFVRPRQRTKFGSRPTKREHEATWKLPQYFPCR